jgi:hypothetical protein
LTGSTDSAGDGERETEGLLAAWLAVVAGEIEGESVCMFPRHDDAANIAVTSSTSARLCMSGMLSVPT